MSTSMILENPDAAAFGAAGLACQLIWPLFSVRNVILRTQMGIGACVSETLAILMFAPRLRKRHQISNLHQ